MGLEASPSQSVTGITLTYFGSLPLGALVSLRGFTPLKEKEVEKARIGCCPYLQAMQKNLYAEM